MEEDEKEPKNTHSQSSVAAAANTMRLGVVSSTYGIARRLEVSMERKQRNENI